jgi:hypothetical protein
LYFAFDRLFLSRHVIFYKAIDKHGNFAGVLLRVKREFAPPAVVQQCVDEG